MNNIIFYKRPKIRKLLSEGYTCVDMHVHTKFSGDSGIRVNALLKKARKKGIGVAITDHNEIRGAQEAWQKKGSILIIPGMEVRCASETEFLVYFYELKDLEDFYNKVILPKKGRINTAATSLHIKDLFTALLNYRCVVAAPHPFYPHSGIMAMIKKQRIFENTLDLVDFFEVINCAMSRRRNTQAIESAQKLGKGMIAGSDSHVIKDIGKAVTYAKGKTAEEFLDSIASKQGMVVGKNMFILSKIQPALRMISYYIKHPIYYINYNLSKLGLFRRFKSSELRYKIKMKKARKKLRRKTRL